MARFASTAPPCAPPESDFPVDVEDFTIPPSLCSKQQPATLKTQLEKAISAGQAWPGAYFKRQTLTLPSSHPPS